VIERASLVAALALVAIASMDTPLSPRAATPRTPRSTVRRSACEGARDTLPAVLLYELAAGAFPGSARPDVAVHVPPGFDGTQRPGVVVYFHGWQGCVAAALSGEETPCTDGGALHPGIDLASSIDAASVNAVVVAVELRAEMPTGEPGKLAMPAGLRDLLRELFERMTEPLGCTLDVDALDRVVLVAHSGGYQALAGALALGDVPRVTEVDLLDSLYGADDVFLHWIRSQAPRFDPRVSDPLRFVDLYTCCGGTADKSRALAQRVSDSFVPGGLGEVLFLRDVAAPPDAAVLAHGVVFQRVAEAHSDVPHAYFGELVRAAGFAHIDHPLRPK
jgi:hypothetical protein